jgi:hypothetical protein
MAFSLLLFRVLVTGLPLVPYFVVVLASPHVLCSGSIAVYQSFGGARERQVFQWDMVRMVDVTKAQRRASRPIQS